MVKPLINTPNMPWFENPEEGERIRQDNIDFQKEQENATPERTSNMQREIREWLYWSKEDSINKLDWDSQYFPNLKTLYESWHIDKDTFIKTAEALDEAKLDEELDVFLKVVNKLSDSNVRDSLIKWLENKDEINENNFEKTEFFKDSKELDIDLDAWIGWLELMLARNYISINNVDGTQDKTRDLSKSMDTSLNEILKNSSNDFKKQNWPLITEIKSEKSLNRKYSLLKDLYKEDLKRDAILWGKKSNEEIKRKKISLIEKAKDISEKIKEAQNIKDDKQKNQEIERLNLEKQKIIEEWKDIDWFDAEVQTLSWWKKDSSPEDKEKRDEN